MLSQETVLMFSPNQQKLILNRCNYCWRDINLTNVRIQSANFCSRRERIVTHMAEQEFALSALRRLELEVNNFKRAKKSDIESVLKGNVKDIFVKSDETVFLLRCCGALLPNEKLQTRKELTKAVWKKLCDSGVQLLNEHFIALLKTNFENRHTVCPVEFLSEMKRLEVEPDSDTLTVLLSCVNISRTHQENVKILTVVIEELKSRGFFSNAETLVALASVLAETGNLSEAEDVVEKMRKSLMEVTLNVHTSFLKGYIMLGMEKSVLKLLDHIKKSGLKFSPAEYASIVSKLAEVSSLPGSDSKQMMDNMMPHIAVPTTEDTCNYVSNAVLELMHQGKEDASLKLVQTLPSSLQFGSRFLDPLLILFCKEIIRTDVPPEKVLEMCDQLEEFAVKLLKKEGSLKPFLIHTVTRYALESGNRDLSLFLLEVLSNREVVLRPHYFWPLMIASGNTEDEEKSQEGVLQMLNKMINLRVEPNFETLAHYVLPFMKPRNSALTTLTLLANNGVTGILLKTSVTHWLLEKGNLVEAFHFNDIHHGLIDPLLVLEPLAKCVAYKMDKSDLKSLAKLLKAMGRRAKKGIDHAGHFLLELTEKLGLFVKNGNVSENSVKSMNFHLTVLEVLDACNIKISQKASNILLDALHPQLELNEADLSSTLQMPAVDEDLILPASDRFNPIIPHPRDMNVEELESHLVELRAKGLNDRGVLRRLFQHHCRLKNLKRVLQVKEEMDKGGHMYSPGMLSSLLDVYIHDRLADKSIELFLQIKSDYPKFKLDEFKVIDLAELMCRDGNVEGGITLLRDHSKTAHVRAVPGNERNIVNLLEAVHNSSTAHQSPSSVPVTEASGIKKSKGGQSIWTAEMLLNELINLGYVSNPPHKSIIFKLKAIVR